MSHKSTISQSQTIYSSATTFSADHGNDVKKAKARCNLLEPNCTIPPSLNMNKNRQHARLHHNRCGLQMQTADTFTLPVHTCYNNDKATTC